MAKSFDDAVKVLDDYHAGHRDSLSNKAPAKWSTTPYASYEEMLTALDGTDINEEYQEHYPGGSGTKEQALRIQATFVANMRRGVRSKLVSSVCSRRGRVDASRYAYIDTIAARALISRMKSWANSKAGASE